MADVNVTVGGDASKLDAEMRKAQMSVGKTVAGIGKGLSTVIGSSLGPFGELIEKADAFRAAISGATMGTKLLAGGVGLAFAGTAYLVDKAIEKTKELNDLLESNRKAREENANAMGDYFDKLSQGVETQNRDVALNYLDKEIESLKERNQVLEDVPKVFIPGAYGQGSYVPGEMSPEAIAERDKNLKLIAKAEATRGRVSNPELIAAADRAAYERELSPEARASMRERSIRQAASGLTQEGINALRQQIEQLKSIQENAPLTRAGGETVTAAQESIKTLEEILKFTTGQSLNANRNGSQNLPISQLTSIGGRGGPSVSFDISKRQLTEAEKQTNILQKIDSNTQQEKLLQ